jgi:hypothetical protein
MSTLVVLLLLAAAGWVVWKMLKKPDVNNDGKVDTVDVAAAAKEVAVEAKAEVVKVADVNKDGKVDIADAVAVVEKVKKARKPRAKKAE